VAPSARSLARAWASLRLAKRDEAHALAKLRAEGATPEEVRAMTGIDKTLKYFR